MNEEEIINILTDDIVALNVGYVKYEEAVQGLLDLYNKEKERNKDLEQIEKEHKEENGRLRNELEKLSKLLYLCTPEIPQCQHGKYVSYVDLVKKLEKKDKIINDMAIDLEYINKEILDEYDKLPYAESKQKVIDYFTNKVEEDTKE